ncbi:unnamed protein product [Effrenium voratum]|nr:unnamed protein product [Effrenium voratum]
MRAAMALGVLLPSALAACQEALHRALKAPERWMGVLKEEGCLPPRLADLTIIGSHDSGAYWLGDRAAHCGAKCRACELAPRTTRAWGLAQRGPILQQLLDGVRYFDLRLTVDRSVEGCRHKDTVTAECWKAQHCLLGPPAANLTRDVRSFLLMDKNQSEVVILNLKLEFFTSTGWQGQGPELTRARLEVLRQLLVADLGDFMSEEEGWWLQPLQRLKRRLVVLIQGRHLAVWLQELQAQGVKYLHDFQKCSAAAGDVCDGPLWGKYSWTCCKASKLGREQLLRLQVYNQNFLANLSYEEVFQVERPLLQLYWTMTYSLSGSLETEQGLQLESLEAAAAVANPRLAEFYANATKHEDLSVFANIIMGDWIDRSTDFLEVALRATLSRELGLAPDGGSGGSGGSDGSGSSAARRSRRFAGLVILVLGCVALMAALIFFSLRRPSPCARGAASRRFSPKPWAVSHVQLADRR